MQTYWEISVQCYADGKPGTSCSCSKPTLPTALTEGVELASYYRISCGYDVTIELTERCCRCRSRLGGSTMNLAYRLADVNGTLCVVCSMPMQNEPTIVDQYWPTTVRTWDLLQTYCDNPAYDRATWPTLLDGFSCKQSYPGEYWIEDTTSHAMRGVYLSLTNGGRTLPIKTEQRPFPRPKSRLPLEYRDGRWWKNTAAGWKQA